MPIIVTVAPVVVPGRAPAARWSSDPFGSITAGIERDSTRYDDRWARFWFDRFGLGRLARSALTGATKGSIRLTFRRNGHLAILRALGF